VPLSYAIDRGLCIGCGLCEKVCQAEAVTYDDQPRRTDLEVGAVILATGCEPFDPSDLGNYGYTASPDVLTSVEFERILSASGPFMGRLMRPYDREEPSKIAWLQCVGSRSNRNGENPYCSSVCCMYAIKEAVIAKEHAHSDLDAAIFYMDMRTCGKEFEEYYHRAENEHGVRFIRSRIHSVEPVGEGDLKVNYVESGGELHSEVFNLVVLSVGFQVGREAIELAGRLGIELDKYNFASTDSFMPVATSRPGIYVCGGLQSSKDIPLSVMEASAAAAASSALLKDARWTQTQTKEIPAERNIAGEPPRIGVFICQCGINISGIVNVFEVEDYAKTLPYVIYTEVNLYTCSQDTQAKIAQVIKQQGINRVVIAACTPKTHEPLFQETLQSAGLNKYVVEMANIRNQDSWVHGNDPRSATEKAQDLVRMAVAKAALLEPLPELELDLNPVALVVGGGLSGMTAAKNLADQGYEVHMVERAAELGGQARFLYKTWKGESIRDYLGKLIGDIEENPRIHVYPSTELHHVEGFVGNFTSVLRPKQGDEIAIKHGVAIIATGDEVIAPGTPLTEGKLYASNLITISAWCSQYGMKTSTSVVKDQKESIANELTDRLRDHDAIITSGGAWRGDRDLVVGLLNELGWQEIYHRVRIGPGKAIGFGLFDGKPIFCLPGGPPSNHMAFLQLALPGLQKLDGHKNPGLPKVVAQLTETIRGMRSWTQFIHGRLELSHDRMTFQPLKLKSRLQMMAEANSIGMIPEGTEVIPEGTMIPVQVLS